jgi:hypothetical protein
MSEDFRDGPAPAEDTGRQVRLVTLAAGVGALLLVASVVVDVAWADEPVTPELPDVPRPTLPTDLPSGFPTDLPTEFPSEFPTELPSELPTDLPTDLPDLPSNFPTELPDLPTDFPTLPELPGGDG